MWFGGLSLWDRAVYGKGDPVPGIIAKYGASALYIPDFNLSRGHLFQDSAGTTPVTAIADPIGQVVPTTGVALTQATAGSRGTLRQVSTRYVWQGDGVDDNLLSALNPAVATTLIVACKFNSTVDVAIGARTDANTQLAILTNGAGLLSGQAGTQNQATINGGSDIRGVPGVAALRFNGTTVSLFWKPFTGTLSTIYSAAQAGSPTTTAPLGLGAQNAAGVASAPLDGDIYAALAIQAAMTDAEIAAVATQFSN